MIYDVEDDMQTCPRWLYPATSLFTWQNGALHVIDKNAAAVSKQRSSSKYLLMQERTVFDFLCLFVRVDDNSSSVDWLNFCFRVCSANWLRTKRQRLVFFPESRFLFFASLQRARPRVARFVLVRDTKTGEKCTKWAQNVPNSHKISQMSVKYPRCPPKCQHFPI
jgi:hypothetical protein